MNTTDAEIAKRLDETTPTVIGCYYWSWGKGATNGEAISVFNIEGKLCVWESVQQRFVSVKEFGGLWGGRVPAPGTTFTIQEFLTWIHDVVSNSTFRFIDPIINDPQSSIAATTERHGKEQG